MIKKSIIDPSKPEPIYNQIKNLILSKIASGEFKPHDQLPSERDYQILSGASRQTVRRALDELVHQNILYRKPGKGTYVADQVSDLPLFSVTGSFTHLAYSPEHDYRIISLEKLTCPPSVARIFQLPASSPIVFIEQLALVREEARFIHRSYLPLNVGEKLLHIKQIDLSVLEMLILFCDQKPAVSRDLLTPGVADQHDSQILGIENNALVQIQSGVIYKHANKPIESHKLVIRGDRFKQDLEYKINANMIERIVSQRNHLSTKKGNQT